jgi:hypothetical protein
LGVPLVIRLPCATVHHTVPVSSKKIHKNLQLILHIFLTMPLNDGPA